MGLDLWHFQKATPNQDVMRVCGIYQMG